MKLTKNKLKQIIREELENAMSEVERPKTTEASRDANKALVDQHAKMKDAEKARNTAKEKHTKATDHAIRNPQGRNYDWYADMYMYQARAELAAAEAVYKTAVETYEQMHEKIKPGK